MSDLKPPHIPDLPPTLDPADSERMLDEIQGSQASPSRLASLRHLPTRARLALAVLLTAMLLTASTLIQGLRPDLTDASTELAGPLGLLVVTGVLSLGFAFRPIYKPTPRPKLRTFFAIAGSGLAVVTAATPGLWPGIYLPEDMAQRADAACATGSMVTGLLVVGIFWLLDRHAGSRLFSALAVLSTSTLLAFVVQTVHCPAIDLHHLLGSHTLAASIAGLFALRLAMRGSGSARG